MDRARFLEDLAAAAAAADARLPTPIKKAIVAALGQRDEKAEVCKDADGNFEPDPELRDYEYVPLKQDVREYFDREVRPYVPDAWINESKRDKKDGQVGIVGYTPP